MIWNVGKDSLTEGVLRCQQPFGFERHRLLLCYLWHVTLVSTRKRSMIKNVIRNTYLKSRNFREDKFSRISPILSEFAKLNPREIFPNGWFAKINPRENIKKILFTMQWVLFLINFIHFTWLCLKTICDYKKSRDSSLITIIHTINLFL